MVIAIKHETEQARFYPKPIHTCSECGHRGLDVGVLVCNSRRDCETRQNWSAEQADNLIAQLNSGNL